MNVYTRPQQETASALQVCPICDKAFTREPSFSRHVKYCRKAQARRKGRPRACLACSSSKTKCNFATPQCSRCGKKDLECVYESRDQLDPVSRSVNYETGCLNPHSDLVRASHHDPAAVLPWEQCQISPIVPFHANGDFGGQHEHAPLFGDVGLESFEEFIGSVVEWNAVDESLEMVNRTETSSDNVTTYSSPSAEYFIAKSRATRALTPLSQDTSTSRHAANLISRIVGAFPQMMLRRHTFPPFIHSYWHEPVVPANLANCMSIAQLFVSRTSDTRPFLWRTIEAEQQRLLDQKYMFTAPEVQQAIQAMTIYIVMAIIDQDEDTPARGARLMQAFMDLKIQLQCLIGGDLVISETEAANPSATWEDWIFAESRRRLGCLWFAITRVFALKTDRAHCASMDDFHNLPLLSGKCIWETRTREEWDIERHLDDSNYPLVTLGELLTALKAPGDAVYGRKLKNWEAGVDKLGMTMNIAAELAA